MLTKIALETPLSCPDLGFRYGDYLFVLGHLWSNPVYREAVLYWQRTGKPVYLDNSAFELSTSISNTDYFQVIGELRPDIIVVPDAVGQFKETVRLARSFFTEISGSAFMRHRFMIVPQGKDNRERMKCYHALKGMGFPFHMIGLPRHAYPYRVELLYNLMKFTNKSNMLFHFLGVPDPKELNGISPLLHSLDTSWVAKDAIGKGGFDSLNFEADEVEESAFLSSLEKLVNALQEGDEGE